MKAADESCQSTLQSGHGFVCAGKYPHFPVYFACPGENLKIAARPLAFGRLKLYLWLAADFARRNPEWARVLYLELWPSVLVTQSALR